MSRPTAGRHIVHTHGRTCNLCGRHRLVLYLPRTIRRRPWTVLICEHCDTPLLDRPRETPA